MRTSFNKTIKPTASLQKTLYVGVTVLAVWLYAWFASFLARAEIRLPAEIVSQVVVRSSTGEVENLENAQLPYEAMSMESELGALRVYLRQIGMFSRRVELLISVERPWLYHVSAERVELGIELLRMRHQLTHALLKTWVLQKLKNQFKPDSSELADASQLKVVLSALHLDIIADQLLAIQRGHLDLEVKGRNLHFQAEPSFIATVASLGRMCESPWMSVHLMSYCTQLLAQNSHDTSSPQSQLELKSDKLFASEWSQRQFIGSALWAQYKKIGFQDRHNTVLNWIDKVLSSPFSTNELVLSEKISLNELRTWTKQQLRSLSYNPSDSSPEAIELPGELKPLDFVLQSQREIASGISEFRTGIIKTAGKEILWPGRVLLSASETKEIIENTTVEKLFGRELHATKWILEVCDDEPRAEWIEQLIKLPVQRVLLVQNKACKETNYSSFLTWGIEAFAFMNKQVGFAQIHVPSLRLALEKGLRLKGFLKNIVTAFGVDLQLQVGDHDVSLPVLGAAQARWNRTLDAYRIQAPIEAVEWMREAPAQSTL